MLSWKWAADRLTRSRGYWISTTCPDGAPHVMVVWGLWWDNQFYFRTGSQSRKARILDENAKYVICNENADEAVIVEGTAERMRDVPRSRKFTSLYERKYEFDMSGMADAMISLKEPVFAVRPHKVFGLTEKKFSTSATRWTFGK